MVTDPLFPFKCHSDFLRWTALRTASHNSSYQRQFKMNAANNRQTILTITHYLNDGCATRMGAMMPFSNQITETHVNFCPRPTYCKCCCHCLLFASWFKWILVTVLLHKIFLKEPVWYDALHKFDLNWYPERMYLKCGTK